jgi:hypothetical protein
MFKSGREPGTFWTPDNVGIHDPDFDYVMPNYLHGKYGFCRSVTTRANIPWVGPLMQIELCRTAIKFHMDFLRFYALHHIVRLKSSEVLAKSQDIHTNFIQKVSFILLHSFHEDSQRLLILHRLLNLCSRSHSFACFRRDPVGTSFCHLWPNRPQKLC